MHRVLISSPVIGSYSFCMLLGITAGYLLARFNARRIGIERRHIDNVALLAAAAGLAGARIFSWLFFFPPGLNLWYALTHTGGGMVFYGGVVFGMAAAVLYARLRRIRLRDLIDVLAAPLALGLAIGRIGCFLAGCCWGDLCVDVREYAALDNPRLRYQVQTFPWLSGKHFPLAVRFPADCGALNQHHELGLLPAGATESLPVHPVQLYEAALSFVLVLALQRRLRRRARAGEVFCALCVGYGAMRFGLEFLRADNAPAYFGLTLSQVISVIAVAVGVILLTVRRTRLPDVRCEVSSVRIDR